MHSSRGFHHGSEVKNLPASVGDVGSIPGSGRAPGEGDGNPRQYSCLENPMDRGAIGSQSRKWLSMRSMTALRVKCASILLHSSFFSWGHHTHSQAKGFGGGWCLILVYCLIPYSSCSQSTVPWPATSYHLLDMQKSGPTPSETVVGSAVKYLTVNEGDPGLIPGSGRSPRGGNGNPLQYSGKSHGQRSLVGYSPWGLK